MLKTDQGGSLKENVSHCLSFFRHSSESVGVGEQKSCLPHSFSFSVIFPTLLTLSLGELSRLLPPLLAERHGEGERVKQRTREGRRVGEDGRRRGRCGRCCFFVMQQCKDGTFSGITVEQWARVGPPETRCLMCRNSGV